MKCVTIDALEFDSGHRVELSIMEGVFSIKGSVPCDELDQFCRALKKRTSSKKPRSKRCAPVPMRYELEWTGDPAAYDAASLVGRVAAQCTRLAKTAITRGELQAKLSKVLGVDERRILNTISTLIHKENSFEITEVMG